MKQAPAIAYFGYLSSNPALLGYIPEELPVANPGIVAWRWLPLAHQGRPREIREATVSTVATAIGNSTAIGHSSITVAKHEVTVNPYQYDLGASFAVGGVVSGLLQKRLINIKLTFKEHIYDEIKEASSLGLINFDLSKIDLIESRSVKVKISKVQKNGRKSNHLQKQMPSLQLSFRS